MTVRTADTEPLAHLWRRQFLAELDRKIVATRNAVEASQAGGWYRGQLEEALRMYQAARNAAKTSEDKL